MNCPSCGTENARQNKFCSQCGATMAPTPTCRACGTAMDPGAKFCTSCGTTVAPVPDMPQGPGYVVDGEWHRAPGELVRLVPGDALRSAFGRLVPGVDWGSFLRGTLVGKVLDSLLSNSIRIPMGSVGVVTKDGRCVKVLPPGDQTTPGLLRDLLAGDLETAAAGAFERLIGAQRFALYLVDRRPVPVSFTTDVPMKTGVQTLQATALLSVGAHPDALTAFLTDVVGDNDTLAAEDLYVRFRSEIERAVSDALRARPDNVPQAEKVARDALRAKFGARSGLSFDLVLAPRHTVHRLDVILGGGAVATAACTGCKQPIKVGQKFCIHCGAVQAPPDAGDGLFTSDGQVIELDLALSVQAERAPEPPVHVLFSAAAKHLRTLTFADLQSPDGLAGIEAALNAACDEALAALGFRLLALNLVDLRSMGNQWALGARAAITQAQAEQRVGREWLAVRDDEIALEGLNLASAAKAEQVRRDAVFGSRTAALADARRTAEIEAGERALARQKAEGQHGDAVAADARTHERAMGGAKSRSELERERMGLESERRRQDADDTSHAEKLRREARLAEVGGMADIDAKLAAQEQKHRIETMNRLAGQSEAQMLAMQAGDLAAKEHGGAFAEALGKLVDGSAAKAERERADAMALANAAAMTELHKAAIEGNAKVGAARASAPSSCPTCGQPLAPGARFCGGCGTSMV